MTILLSLDPSPSARLGYGTMKLTGPGGWGRPHDETAAIKLLWRAADLGVHFYVALMPMAHA